MAIDFDSLTPEARAAVMASGLLNNMFDDVIATLARRGIAQRADDTLTKEPKTRPNKYVDHDPPSYLAQQRKAIKAAHPGIGKLADVFDAAYGGKPKKNRYGNVARPTHYKGSRYDSKAEAEYAAWLDWRIGSTDPVAWWLRQIKVPLGPDFAMRVDFLVAIGHSWSTTVNIEAHEVKGLETPQFKKVRRLWPKYAPFPLHIIKRGNVEIINGA